MDDYNIMISGLTRVYPEYKYSTNEMVDLLGNKLTDNVKENIVQLGVENRFFIRPFEQYIQSNTTGLLMSVGPIFAIILAHLMTYDDKFSIEKPANDSLCKCTTDDPKNLKILFKQKVGKQIKKMKRDVQNLTIFLVYLCPSKMERVE